LFSLQVVIGVFPKKLPIFSSVEWSYLTFWTKPSTGGSSQMFGGTANYLLAHVWHPLPSSWKKQQK